MQVYTELVAPSAVSHSLSLPFTSVTANNLLVAKGSLLQIFETRIIAAEIDNRNQQDEPRNTDRPFDARANDDDGLESDFLGGEAFLIQDNSQHTKLVLVAEVAVAGNIIGLARVDVKNTASGGSALLLAYRGAKMALTQWNPQRRTLDTTSIHYYEKDELQGAPWELNFGEYVNYLEADPASRCAAFKFGSRNLAILPFRQAEEDLEMDDWDEDLDGPRPAQDASMATGTENSQSQTIYTPSFVLRLPLLDPTLLHPIHLAFLHEYREPTFGIIASAQAPSSVLGTKDHMTYKVFTLDLQQRASTTILSVTGLPQDLQKVIPLPGPIGGALLVGTNELIHIDQSGKPNGVAVNPMTRQTTSFSLADQADLDIRLEGCAVEVLSIETGELLLILSDGRLGLISFKVDGRTVSGLTVTMISADCGGDAIKSRVSCISKLDNDALFIGSESNDSIILGWTRKHTTDKRKKPRLDPDLTMDMDDFDVEDDDSDDDLYGTESTTAKPLLTSSATSKTGDFVFRVHDTLISISPMQDFAPGKQVFLPGSEEATLRKGVSADLQLLCAVGRGKAGAIAILNRNIHPKVIGRFEFPESRGFWTMCVKKPLGAGLGPTAALNEDYEGTDQHDKLMIVAKVDPDGYETSDVYALTGAGFESLKGTEFEPAAGITIEAGCMGNRMRVIQVLKSEIRSYDGDLAVSQILEMEDEATGAEPRAVSASIVDLYILVIRDDGSVFVAKINPSHDYELEELKKPVAESDTTKWKAGCLYIDSKRLFSQPATSADEEVPVVMFLLSSAGSLHIYALPDLSKPVYVAEGFSSVPPFLSPDFVGRRGATKENLAELLVADLGDVVDKSPYLILRHATDDVTIYEPIRYQAPGTGSSVSETLFFKKAYNPTIAERRPEQTDEDATSHKRYSPLRACGDIGGYCTVFMPGDSPSFIIKSGKSVPRVIGLQGLGVRGLSTFHTEGCERGFIYADTEGIARVSELPTDHNFTELGLSVKKMAMDCDISKVSFHPLTGTYIAGCSINEPFELPKDDDYHKEWAKETQIFPPTMSRGVLKLISPETWTVIHTVEMEPCESIESMMSLRLEVSEETREQKMLVAVGTALSKGEDLPTRGRVQVFDIVAVIPEPGRPETNKKLKILAKEDLPRGGVTSLSEIGTQGLILVAQGQKCMVRGLREDGSLLPVAFLDMNCHVTSVRGLPGTGLCLLADAFKGLWFGGYTEEPYTFKILGKSNGNLPLLVADFLPDGDDLSLVASDVDGDLHVFEYNPEHPKSLQGHLLLHISTFALGPNQVNCTIRLPRSVPASALPPPNANGVNQPPPQILILGSPSGQLAALTPLTESSYRRLLSLTNQLLPSINPYGGLHPKAYRLPEGTSSGTARVVGVETAASGRMIVDGAVLARWTEVGAAKRAEMAMKGGYEDVAEMRNELETVLGWSGMAYF
ncbi:hypothetical protein VHEMI03686 [[Torrubiella] hemipterigena]|uniref:Uncharacterized protein n=1 Tax=[Torrubiella] hemipterigena TaxID=1531966 RepID=A0A0A1TE70_9HYPO|nr:hypothetical protein VHEMI03686 [[Torrubiella] hemipterigena]